MKCKTEGIPWTTEKYKYNSYDPVKMIVSGIYNSVYTRTTGEITRWSNDLNINPAGCPFGPEVVDIEVSKECTNNCTYCYKRSENKVGGVNLKKNMTFERFKKVCDNLPPSVYQINFGIGDIDANKNLWRMMQYAKESGSDLAIAINGSRMKEDYYKTLAYYCKCVAVSLHNKDTCYTAVGKLVEAGVGRVEIHCLLSKETIHKCLYVLDDIKTDKRLSKVSKVIFQWLKNEGLGYKYDQIDNVRVIRHLIEKALKNKVEFGFDGCSAGNYVAAIKDLENRDDLLELVEPCQATLYTYYINVDGIGFPCPFLEKNYAYSGIDIAKCDNFDKAWLDSKQTNKFRKALLDDCRLCPLFDIHLVDLLGKK